MFVQRNFLFIVMALSVAFAIAMGATVFQRGSSAPPAAPVSESSAFRSYWFGGEAEINRYRLEQVQDEATQDGEAVLLFVTEDFRTDQQVKAESETGQSRAVSVLKANYIRRFTTGISDYSLFTSIFTPISNLRFPNTLKVSTSVQQWDGHSYVQVSYKDNGYQVSGQLYTESAGAANYTIDKALLEDELINRIRLSPAALPTGAVKLIPGTQGASLRHQRLDPLPAKLALDTALGTQWQRTYSPRPVVGMCVAYEVKYTDDERKLLIVFDTTFPYRIVGWEETYKLNDRLLTSRAVLTRSLQSNYWHHTTPADSVLRRQLSM